MIDDLTLLQTCFHPPLLTADVVMRSRIDALSPHGVKRKFMPVIAPAGYGK